MAAAQQPGQTLASHLVAQTLSSIQVLEQLHVLSPQDAAAIRERLPSPYATFPQLATQATGGSGVTAMTSQMGSVGVANGSPNLVAAAAAAPAAALGASPVAAHQVPALPVRQSPAPAINPMDTQPRARALWDYTGTEADDLQFRKDDMILIDEEVNEQWFRGRVIPPGGVPSAKGGLFPSNYVEKIAPGGPNAHTPAYGAAGAPAYGTANTYYHEKQQQPAYGAPNSYQPPVDTSHQQPATIVVQDDEPQKKKFGGKYGKQLGSAAVTGAGFGFGSAVASNIVNAIL